MSDRPANGVRRLSYRAALREALIERQSGVCAGRAGLLRAA